MRREPGQLPHRHVPAQPPVRLPHPAVQSGSRPAHLSGPAEGGGLPDRVHRQVRHRERRLHERRVRAGDPRRHVRSLRRLRALGTRQLLRAPARRQLAPPHRRDRRQDPGLPPAVARHRRRAPVLPVGQLQRASLPGRPSPAVHLARQRRPPLPRHGHPGAPHGRPRLHRDAARLHTAEREPGALAEAVRHSRAVPGKHEGLLPDGQRRGRRAGPGHGGTGRSRSSRLHRRCLHQRQRHVSSASGA